MSFIKSTEAESHYNNLELMSTADLLKGINAEDKTVALAVEKALPQIAAVIDTITDKMLAGGRLFYIGAGTSGRLGILDASECPPTYGVPFNLVVGLIAGGDAAIRKAVENAEDNDRQAWLDLSEYAINEKDFVIGIAASGTTPYVIGGLRNCRKNSVSTACITCNKNAPIVEFADYKIEVETGAEFVTGSTRMKAGTAQKLILNMISTTVMIKLGRVEGNKMVDMKMTNAKLIARGVKMIMDATGLSQEKAENSLRTYGSVRDCITALKNS